MRHPKLIFTLLIFFNILAIGYLQAQVCDPNVLTGPNQVVNPGFENGDDGSFYTDIPCSWNDISNCSCHGSYSEEGQYYIGNRPNEATPCGSNFQNGWSNSPRSGNLFLMVDGKGGATDPIVWQQTVTVESNKYYYFETWISGLGNNAPANRAKLKFKINGIVQAVNIDAPAGGSGWVKYSQPWLSTVDGPITIQIIDNQPDITGPEKDDFGLDDITFRIGCPDAALGRQPDLGPDLTFCGTPITTFTLDPGLSPLQFGETIYWSTGSTGTPTIDVSTGGTYYVCLEQTGSCAKIDTIVVSDRFTIDLGSNLELCDPAALTLDASFTGPGVTYQWYKDDVPLPLGTTKTLFVNDEGEYKVVVDDPICQTEQDSIDVRLRTGSPSPNNIDFCLTTQADTSITFSVNPAGTTYEWYDVPSGGTPILTGASSIVQPGIVTGDTLYVQDLTIQTSTAGSTAYSNANMNNGYDKSLGFTFTNDFSINSLQIPFRTWYSDGDGEPGFRVTIEVVDANGNSLSPARNFTSSTSLETIPANHGNNNKLYTFPFSGFDISSAWGTNLRLKLKSSTHPNGAPMYHTTGFSFPINSIPSGNVTITNSYNGDAWVNGGLDADGYSYFFNWNISQYSPCSRIPVMARDICVLPVTFAGIKAIKTDHGVKIFWATASEKDNSHFEIERLINGDWVSIGQVPANGNSSDYIQYDFTDLYAPNQLIYYRIKQVDFDGKSSYSSVVSVDNISFLAQLRPNPANGATILTIFSGEESTSKVTVHDALGRLVEELSVTNNQEQKIGEHYSTGVYIISIWAGPTPEKIKFIRK